MRQVDNVLAGKSPGPIFHLDTIHAFEVPRIRGYDSCSRGTSEGADPKVGIRDTFAGGFKICFEQAEELRRRQVRSHDRKGFEEPVQTCVIWNPWNLILKESMPVVRTRCWLRW
jgi:hypothetical protein